MRYSIEDTTLTGIADALRRYHGETRLENSDDSVGVKISKTPNATGFDSWEGNYYPNGKVYDVVKIDGANTIKVKMAYQTQSQPNVYVEVVSGNHDKYTFPTGAVQYGGKTLSTVELTFENTDTVTFRFNNIYTADNYLGYYAEVTGYPKIEVPNTYSSSDMEDAIDSIIPEEVFNLTGAIIYAFSNNRWNWFIEKYGNKITTNDLSDASYVFNNSSRLTNIPFEFNFKNGGTCNSTFNGCENLKAIPKLNFPENQTAVNVLSNAFKDCKTVTEIDDIKNAKFGSIDSMFEGCFRLRYAPKFINCDWSYLQSNSSAGGRSLFANCYSLREYPQEVLDNWYGTWTSYLYPLFYYIAQNCYALDEIKGISPVTGAISSAGSLFQYSFNHASRLKDFTFKVQEDGTPYTAKWKGAVMDFTVCCGYISTVKNLLVYNSGITADKEVTDDASYQALKDDPDWFTAKLEYSRYNKTSAINTINSLPDTSAYGNNTIKFKGEAGSLTDGGAINTMTEEEIAVAAAKGWTVTFA